jgi:hypothetical protein
MNKNIKTALGKLFMYSAFFHMGMLSLQALEARSLEPINYFNVLDFDYFFPDIIYGGMNHLLSAVLAALILYYLYTREVTKQKNSD